MWCLPEARQSPVTNLFTDKKIIFAVIPYMRGSIYIRGLTALCRRNKRYLILTIMIHVLVQYIHPLEQFTS
jgi:hypothetical protein